MKYSVISIIPLYDLWCFPVKYLRGRHLESDADRPLSINVCRQYNQEDRHTIMMRIYWGGYLESDADRQLSMNVCRQ
jgi:hypothetical protein